MKSNPSSLNFLYLSKRYLLRRQQQDWGRRSQGLRQA